MKTRYLILSLGILSLVLIVLSVLIAVKGAFMFLNNMSIAFFRADLPFVIEYLSPVITALCMVFYLASDKKERASRLAIIGLVMAIVALVLFLLLNLSILWLFLLPNYSLGDWIRLLKI